MNRRIIGLSLAVIFGGSALLVTWVYLSSENHFHSFALPPPFTFEIPNDNAAITRGDHLTRTRGCRGCHGEDLTGQLMWEFAVAPNLPELARNQSAATLEAAIRHGIDHNGRAMYSMPSYNFVRLRDADIADIIAYLRSQPVMQVELPGTPLPWSIRWDIALGTDFAIAAIIELVPALKRDELTDGGIARGEYIAMTTCNECHGLSLHADTPWDDETAPSLIIVSAYDFENFKTLMRTGVALGGRELEMMSGVARSRFAYFTDQEIIDLYAFLKDMIARDNEKLSSGQP